MQRPLSLLQRDALISLANGWRWGIDSRTARSLRRRGLVTINRVTLGNGAEVSLPALTVAGESVASAERAAAIATNHNVVILDRQIRDLPLFGGVA